MAPNEETYFDLYDQSPDMCASVNPVNAFILQCNQTLLDRLGRSRDELVGASIFSVYHQSCHEGVATVYAQLHVTGMVNNAELMLRGKDGNPIPVILSVSSVRDPNGAIVASRSVWRELGLLHKIRDEMHLLNDVLEARVAERTAELVRRNTDLEQFAQVASHDLKAPLHGIRLTAAWLRGDCYDLLPEASRNHLDQLQQRVERMEQLLRGILQYAQAGRKELTATEVNTRLLCLRIAESLERPESFMIRVDETMPTLITYQHYLHRALQNLISNSIKHRSRDDGWVRVAHREVDGLDEFSVTDNGPGIETRFQTKIFEMFQTLRPRDEVEGCGIGLSIVKRLVENMGGKISVDSSSSGSTFRFTWPKPNCK